MVYGVQNLVFYLLIILLGEQDSDLEFVFIAMQFVNLIGTNSMGM